MIPHSPTYADVAPLQHTTNGRILSQPYTPPHAHGVHANPDEHHLTAEDGAPELRAGTQQYFSTCSASPPRQRELVTLTNSFQIVYHLCS